MTFLSLALAFDLFRSQLHAPCPHVGWISKESLSLSGGQKAHPLAKAQLEMFGDLSPLNRVINNTTLGVSTPALWRSPCFLSRRALSHFELTQMLSDLPICSFQPLFI